MLFQHKKLNRRWYPKNQLDVNYSGWEYCIPNHGNKIPGVTLSTYDESRRGSKISNRKLTEQRDMLEKHIGTEAKSRIPRATVYQRLQIRKRKTLWQIVGKQWDRI